MENLFIITALKHGHKSEMSIVRNLKWVLVVELGSQDGSSDINK
jgi:hypothetical protein